MFEYIKLWWRLRRINKNLLKQVKQAVVENEQYTENGVKEWIEKNEFGLTHEDLQAQCMSSVKHSNSVIKEVTI